MADADRDSDLGDDSPVSARSEGESSGEQSCESSDEGVGRDVPASHTHQPHQPLPLQTHQVLQHQPLQHQPSHNLGHHASIQRQPLNHQMSHPHQRNSPRPLERELKVRDDFESLKSSLHPHLSSLASLAQGAQLSTPNSVFALAGAGPTGGFPYAPPAFLAPAPPPPAQPAGSASSSSSEGSAAGWSFEEQYKQVRQLYEISDDPQRKEFLDDLFSFMQKRGTPINRLPIMAKSVLDLYELYNLVIARGGLVEVINKKLWQEIIKGLRLPSSITSAAFTLRTQYMKYLYDYECDKKNLSTRNELDAAIEGNKREGRRASGQYDAQAAMALPPLSRVPASLAQLSHHMQPLSMSLAGVPARMPLPPIGPHGHIPPEIEHKVLEYMKILNPQRRDLDENASPPINGHGSIMTTRDALNALDASRFAFWSICSNNNHNPLPDFEPQRMAYSEALNLSEGPSTITTTGHKREASSSRTPPPAAKRPARPASRSASRPASRSASRSASPRETITSPRELLPSPQQRRSLLDTMSPPQMNGTPTTNGINGAAFKITTRGDPSTGDHEMSVSIELNGVTYEGVLFPSGNGQNGHRHLVS